LDNEANRVFRISPRIKWERLHMAFNFKVPSPLSRPLFTVLYYLYPANLLLFLRSPLKYLNSSAVECPYTETWEQTLDQDQIRRKSEVRISKFIIRLHRSLPCSRTYYGNIVAIRCSFGVMMLQRK
jgi:hypothetical protein